jgi:hypothetical protein
MKRWLPGLALLAGLGCSISFAQTKSVQPFSDPFDRYLKGVKNNRPEPSLQRFAAECGVDLAVSQPRFAVNPGGGWMQVKNLAKGLYNLESDFYTSGEVWFQGRRVLVEIWPISSDVGSEIRVFRCFDEGKLLQAEAIDWTLPVYQDSKAISWGCSRRWERAANGRMQRTKVEFVDELEQPIPRPKLDADDVKELNWSPSLGPLSELKFPPSMLR